MSEFGYAGKILKVDLSSGKNICEPTSGYAERFLGGRGIAAKLYWDMVPPETRAMDPANCLICATGPITGFMGIAGCRWTICGKSAAGQPEAFTHGNLGGKWGPALKYAGYDALAVQGNADRPVYLFIHDEKVETRDASGLWGKSTFDTAEAIRAELGEGVSVLTVGPAAENRVAFATALSDRGASVAGGLGAIFGSKNLKAIVVTGSQRPQAAEPQKLKEVIDYIRPIRAGTFDSPSPWVMEGVTTKESCYGCGLGCSRQSYSAEAGGRFKSFCQASSFYLGPTMRYYKQRNDVAARATRLCDAYGLDTIVMATLIGWLGDCYQQGLINDEQTGLPLSKIGSLEFIESLVPKIAFREGFGDILARGTLKAAESLGAQAEALAARRIATRTGEGGDYDPRLILSTALLYATELRRPVQQLHAVAGNIIISWSSWAAGKPGAFFSTDDLREAARRFWGSEQAVDFSTYAGKALASKMAQDRAYAQESLVLCDVHWPLVITSAGHFAGHVGDPSFESRIISAITGRHVGETELLRTGERIFNLQRAILLRQGWGGRDGDCLMDFYHDVPLKKGDVFFNPEAKMPGPGGAIISRLGAVVERDKFEELKTEYYCLRGWDAATGYPTVTKLQQLALSDVAIDLASRGLTG
ncbi:MAG TPA: aldehyde ferredoxin oxidoreductase N-terminal domain-containing protein [Dehalococcoidales bacterium]